MALDLKRILETISEERTKLETSLQYDGWSNNDRQSRDHILANPRRRGYLASKGR